MKLWLISGCGGLMGCVVRADTEEHARRIATKTFDDRIEGFDCVEVKRDGAAATIISSDCRP
jgi:hypothetical protein